VRRGGNGARHANGVVRKAKVCLRIVLFAFVAAMLLPCPAAHAQQRVDDKLQDTIVSTNPLANAPVDRSKPMLLQADNLVYDNQHNRITASGNVEIYYNNYTVLADKVTYDRAANTLFAQGNVRIKEPSGSIITADQIALTEDLRDGFINSLKIVTKDDVRIAARKATRTEGDTTVFEDGVFTPCKPCQQNPSAPPIWDIRADTITHKEAEGNIYFQNAYFDFFGTPVAYVPYFYAPDPSVKRRSGFLVPSVGYSKDLGYTTEIPYFWAIAPDMDLTLNPMLATNRGILAKATWRQRLVNGTYKIDFAGIDETSRPDNSSTGNLRGSIQTEGDFALGSWWSAGWNATFESDNTFRRYYKLDSVLETDRVSDAHLIGQSDRDYFGAYIYNFGGLVVSNAPGSETSAFPSVDYHYVVGKPVLGGELSLDVNSLALTSNGIATNTPVGGIAKNEDRFISVVDWRGQIKDDLGEVFTPFVNGRADLYHFGDLTDPTNPENDTSSENLARATGAVGLKYEYPFISQTSWGSQTISPVAQIVARPNTLNEGNLPNADAQSLVFDDTLLFDLDKFSGYDRLETGTNLDAGFEYNAFGTTGAHFRALLGESFHLAGQNQFSDNTGLETARSDYVAGLYYSPSSSVQLISQSRLNSESLDLQREDVSAALNYKNVNLAATYSLDLSNPQTGLPYRDQEILATANLPLTTQWSALASARYNLVHGQFITDSIGVKYTGDCVGVTVTYSGTNVNDQDVTPDQTVIVRVDLKYLGGTSFQTDALGNRSANSNPLQLP
jgi:LPS-assembly protein